jgi:hypothetical protein
MAVVVVKIDCVNLVERTLQCAKSIDTAAMSKTKKGADQGSVHTSVEATVILGFARVLI